MARKTNKQDKQDSKAPAAPDAVGGDRLTAFEARWRPYVLGLAGLGIVALVVAETTEPKLVWLRIAGFAGIAIAGTLGMMARARRTCPDCGAAYGYHFRLVKPNACRKCGGEFPGWP